jgi:hypothetical protein
MFSGVLNKTHADILIEPVIGYSIGEFKTQTEDSFYTESESNDSLHGITYGGRLGLQILALQFGLDFLGGFLSVEGEKKKINELGAFIGYKFPAFMRIYAGYIPFANAEGEDYTVGTITGGGYKIGLGFSLLPPLNLNIEWRSINNLLYSDYDSTSVEFNLDSTSKSNLTYQSIKAKYSAIMIALSIPITF